jgi:hypothetical protein
MHADHLNPGSPGCHLANARAQPDMPVLAFSHCKLSWQPCEYIVPAIDCQASHNDAGANQEGAETEDFLVHVDISFRSHRGAARPQNSRAGTLRLIP